MMLAPQPPKKNVGEWPLAPASLSYATVQLFIFIILCGFKVFNTSPDVMSQN